jgi:hypothetical protein
MYMTPANNPEPHSPVSTQYPLRPASRTSPFRINVIKSLRLHTVTSILVALLVLGLGLAVLPAQGTTLRPALSMFRPPPSRRWSDRELEHPYDSYISGDRSRHQPLRRSRRGDPQNASGNCGSFPAKRNTPRFSACSLPWISARVGTTYQVEIGSKDHALSILPTS